MNPFDEQNTPLKKYPTRFYARTWPYWGGTLLLVPFALFFLIFMLIFAIYENDAVEKEAIVGGIIAIIVFVLPAIACTFQLYARQRPILKIYKEGLWIRSIGTSTQISQSIGCLLGGYVVFFILFIMALQVITLQAFRIQIFRLRWEYITDMPAKKGTLTQYGELTVDGWYEKDNNEFNQDLTLKHYTTSYGVSSFGTSINKVIETVQFYHHNPDARETLPSWQDEEF
jgi:hypothetical protein